MELRWTSWHFLSLGCFCLSTLLCADDEIVVQLDTDASLFPACLLPTEGECCSASYAKQLEEVFRFDVSNNGQFSLQKHAGVTGAGEFGNPEEWRRSEIKYVVKLKTTHQEAQGFALDVTSQQIQRTPPVALTGKLSEDRRAIHKIADSIHRALFQEDGIASTHLLYTCKLKGESWVAEVWESDYDGANARQLTKEGSCCVTPAYIPPKPGYLTAGFLYVSYRVGQPKIYFSSLKGGNGQRISSLRGNQLMPAISPLRDHIAFISDITGNPDLFIQPFSPEKGGQGKPQQAFSAKQATQGTPSFSPDGKKIAFVSNKDGSPKIYAIDVPKPGTSLKEMKPVLISKRNRENSAPQWSPDGKKIAYCSRSSGGVRQIWIYDFETKREWQLTNGPGNKENPCWAPNSLHLAYNSVNREESELFLVNLNQPCPVQITSGGGQKRFPSWEPRR